ncbi:hypothetical protein FZ983_01715 [Azospirillum sp. B21]|uniref:hypothetical protein n=1 Tax=Azospirillum sp. B21 TaxID=2607496 RepID=UPI0011EEAB68|nr:hypothetical protein [Azospirillum sp. B21]KAA0583359.1 hypothetical protein FZ983_01715 [Azospirillum sp. B21]
MIARLGNVLYWAGCGIAVLILIFAALLATELESGQRWNALSVALMAVAPWLLGLACRYVLAGPRRRR